MIVGHGIDLQELSKVKTAMAKERLVQKVLTEKEQAKLATLTEQGQLQFFAGRWSAKEAFAKAYGTGIGPIAFKDLEILPDDFGAPVFTKSPFSGKVWVSISHSGDFVQASVILEERHDL